VRAAARVAVLGLAVANGASLATAGEIPGAEIVLEAAPVAPGRDASSAPPRFVLLKDGQVFVGGTERLEAGLLEKGEVKALRKRVEQVRKLRDLPARVTMGGDPAVTLRLRLLEDRPIELVATGDPSQAPPHLAPLAGLLADLLRFDHPSLRPWAPPTYAMVVREGHPVGGCRPWGFAFPLTAVLGTPRVVPALEIAGWPTGGVAAAVCADGAGPSAKRFVVTLRPLLPGEQP
jgi:hypothetical protein